MAKKFYGDLSLLGNGAINFEDGDTNLITLKAPAAVSADISFTLPASITASGVVTTDGSGALSTGLLADANVDASAAITLSKLAATTASRALASDASGFITASAATDTELGYLSGVTSAIQTQLGDKVNKAGDTMTGNLLLDNEAELRLGEADGNGTEYVALKAPTAVTTSKTWTLPEADASNGVVTSNGTGTLSVGLIADANVDASAAITLSKLAATTANRALASDASGFITASAATDTELGYLSGVTSALQTQIDGKAGTALDNLTVGSLAAESLLVGSSASAVSALGVGSDGQVLKVVAGSIAWAADTGITSTTATWVNGDGTSKVINHAFGSSDVMVQLYDIASGETVDVDTIDRTDTNNVTLTASEAPASGGSGWKVLVIQVA